MFEEGDENTIMSTVCVPSCSRSSEARMHSTISLNHLTDTLLLLTKLLLDHDRFGSKAGR